MVVVVVAGGGGLGVGEGEVRAPQCTHSLSLSRPRYVIAAFGFVVRLHVQNMN